MYADLLWKWKIKEAAEKNTNIFFCSFVVRLRSHSHIFYTCAIGRAWATLFHGCAASSHLMIFVIRAFVSVCVCVHAVCACMWVNGNSWIRPQANRKKEEERKRERESLRNGEIGHTRPTRMTEKEWDFCVCTRRTHIRHMAYRRRLAVGQWPGGVHAEFSTFRSEVSYTAIWALHT